MTGAQVAADHLTPLVSWNPLPGASAYELFLRNLRNLQDIVPPRVFGTEFQLVDPLLQGLHRMWVRGIDANGNRLPWSEPYDYLVDVPNPSAMKPKFHMTSPGVDGTPEIRFVSVSDPNEPAVLSPFDSFDVFIRDLTAPRQPDKVFRDVREDIWVVPVGLLPDNYRVWTRQVNTVGERGPWSDPAPLNITTPKPVAPTIVQPTGTVTITNGPLVIDWNAVRYADHYTTFIRRTDRVAPDLVTHDIQDTFLSLTRLPTNGSYKVWVRAWTEAGVFSPWSAPQSFNINLPTPAQVTLVGPSGSVQGNPVFSWQAAANAAGYILWLTRVDTNQHPLLLELDLTETQYSSPNPLPAGTYRFWIRAISANGIVGPWSAFRNFTIN